MEKRELAPAPTLKDLAERIKEAMSIVGEDATWNGFDDEALYVYSPKSPRSNFEIKITPR